MNQYLAMAGVSPAAALSIVVALGVFVSLLGVAMPILAGSRLKTRMKSVALEREEIRARERTRLHESRGKGPQLRQREANGLASLVVQRLNLRAALVDESTQKLLRVAGLRGQRQLTLFLFARVSLPLIFLAVALFYIFGVGVFAGQPFAIRVVVCIGFAYLGFYAPIVYAKNVAGKRKQSIQRAWPDALDLLLICVESGQAIEGAFRRVSAEIGIQSIPLAEELVLLNAELSYLEDRRTAYQNFNERCDLEGVRAVVTALIQAERYGTPLGTAIRTMAAENREMRMNAAEKKAAALPPKLTVPMILFFLPVLFVVIIGPAILDVVGFVD